MKVKCIDNGLGVPLTISKIYEVIAEMTNHYQIKDDSDNINTYRKDRFVEYVEPKFVSRPQFKTKEGRVFISTNYSNKEAFVNTLRYGKTFYLPNTNQDTFSIETAIVLRNWLNDMIQIAEESGYFDVKEMTIKEIQEKLGYKIKIVERGNE